MLVSLDTIFLFFFQTTEYNSYYYLIWLQVDKAQAMEKLEAAKPALEEAEAALNTIKPAHISTVRKLAKPPHLIMRIMDCVLLLFQRRLEMTSLDPEKPSPKPSWPDALKLMGGSTFLKDLLSFSKVSLQLFALGCFFKGSALYLIHALLITQ